MLSLAQQQQGLLAILQGRPVNLESDPWLLSVAQCRGRDMIREIGLWWQRFQIESYCRYTSRLMKWMGCFEDCVNRHFNENPTPPSIEELTSQFLSSLENHEDPLLRSVAAFEMACMALSDDRGDNAIIYWDRNPNEVMDALSNFKRLPGPEAGARYFLRMSTESPKIVSCVRIPLRDE